MRRNNFGQAEGLVAVATAAANVGVNAYHAAKTDKIVQAFENKLRDDEAAMAYIRNLVLRFEGLGTRLARTSGIRAGTPEFENLLRKSMINDMQYHGNCNADIFVPPTARDRPGVPRALWGKINRSGFLEQPSVIPPDVGPIWATGCKNAQDQFRIAQAQQIKGKSRFEYLLGSKAGIGQWDIIARIGSGLFLLIFAILMLKYQGAVIHEQKKAKKPRRYS